MSSPPADNPTGDRDPAFGAADLTNCDREAIHIPAAIQPHGVLLTLDPQTLSIVQAGGDTARILGAPPNALPGQPMETWFPPDCVARLRHLLDTEGPMPRPLHAFTLAARQDGQATNAVAHRSGDLVVLELEPLREPSPDDALSQVQAMLLRVHQTTTPQAFCQGLADEVRRISGFDRVMVYRFLPDDSGAVIAEARHAEAESFLGLHYPASDIPRQARALYSAAGSA